MLLLDTHAAIWFATGDSTHHATLITADQRLLRWKHALPRHNAGR